MAYALEDQKLRVCRQISKDKSSELKKARLIILEHILPTTEEFVALLNHAGAEIFALLAKPYSIDKAAYDRMIDAKFRIINKTYDDLEKTTFLDDLLQEAIKKSKEDKKTIVIIDVGGYFAKPLQKLSTEELSLFSGVIEDTTFGHNRYIDSVEKISIPIFSVARSALKEIEARFVGRDAVSAMDIILRKEGVSLPGRQALVLGYGMIGKNVARTLKAKDLKVSTYDVCDHKNLAAYIDGYSINTKKELIKDADIIFSATGNPDGALSFNDIEDCKDNVILVSVGSKDTEFDIRCLKKQAIRECQIGDVLKQYKLHNQKNVIVAKDGTAVNFILPSIPVEVLDLVFSEILSCIIAVIENKEGFLPRKSTGLPGSTLSEISKVHDLPDEVLNKISKAWLRFINR